MQFESDASSPSSKLLERFFTGLSEYAFYSQLGVTDTELVTYVSNLLIRFTKTDALHRIRQLNGRRATEVVTMMAECSIASGWRSEKCTVISGTLLCSGPVSIRSPCGGCRPTNPITLLVTAMKERKRTRLRARSNRTMSRLLRAICCIGSASSSKCARMVSGKFVGNGRRNHPATSPFCFDVWESEVGPSAAWVGRADSSLAN